MPEVLFESLDNDFSGLKPVLVLLEYLIMGEPVK
jgi:hypothetical protein